MVPGGGQAGLGIELLHGGFVFDLVHIGALGAGGDVELGAQPGVPHEPVLVVALQPVDLAVLEGEEGHGLEYLVVILQGGYLIILVQGVPQLLQQLVVGAVADAQHPHAVVAKLAAEFPVGHGEIGGNEYKVFHNLSPLFGISQEAREDRFSPS